MKNETRLQDQLQEAEKQNKDRHLRVCLVAEGCYPYVVGGVSSWIHSLIKQFPNVEFSILAIIADRSASGKFVYEFPENLTEIYEVYLTDVDWNRNKKTGARLKLDPDEFEALRGLVTNRDINLKPLINMFNTKRVSLNDLVMGEDFMTIVSEFYEENYPLIPFSDFLWTLRSVYLPLFQVLSADVPQADIYHSVATGYAGVLGSKGCEIWNGKMLISEHGIYTREREEELIKAKWVEGIYKNVWIDQFKKMSQLAYEKAYKVTSLFRAAREIQIELGLDAAKAVVTPNGIDISRFVDVPGKLEEDQGYINIGAILRVTPIKDVKTMIQAFAFAKNEVPNLKLWIMGPCDEDPEYADECFQMVENLNVKDVIFTGRIKTEDYIGRMDMTILTSISEGQPLTILESFAAHVPTISTDVGSVRELVYGVDDDFGPAGIVTHIMNVEEIAHAMVTIALDSELRKRMAEAGYKRVKERYRIDQMRDMYEALYKEMADLQGVTWTEEPFKL